jgi:protease I
MKRKILFVIIIACFAAVSFGARRSRSNVQKIIQLTDPKTSGGMTFQEALSKLKVVDRFSGQTVDKSVVSQLAWAGLGNRVTPEMAQLTPQPLQSPFPMQLFFVMNDGVYFYQPVNNSLEQILEGDIRTVLASAAPTMPNAVATAGCVVIVTSTSNRGAAARRSGAAGNSKNTTQLEAGHIAQNIQLQAVCLEQGLGSIAITDFDDSAVRKICGLSRDLDVIYMVCVGFLSDQNKPGDGSSSGSAAAKKAAIIVPAENFENVEFFETLGALNQAKVNVTVASNRLGPIIGRNGQPFEPGILANQIRVDNFDAIIVIGGPGAAVFMTDTVVLSIIQEAFDKRKIIGATSYGTSVLAQAGILRSGVKVTGLMNESANIGRMGGIFTGQLVEKDSRIITCSGPQGAAKFARDITDAILGK